MKPEEKILCFIGQIPKKMISLHGIENLPEFLLYEMSGPDCFNLNKAAYFVDNPDFNCFKGITGFARTQSPGDRICVWETPQEFSDCMRQSAFNKDVRSIYRESYYHTPKSDEQMAIELAHELELQKPYYCSWNLKNDNFGLFVYEPCDEKTMPPQECVLNGVCLLSFCPIY